MSQPQQPAVWFPAVRTGTGTDVFTETLAAELKERELRAEIAWLPLSAEYAPWIVPVPDPPDWVNIVHVNTWLHPRFLPGHLPIIATLHHSVHHPNLKPYKGWLRSAYHRHWIRRIERDTMRRADRIVAVSRFAADSARNTLLDRPMQIIPNGVDVEQFRPLAPRPRHGPFRLLYIGGWKRLKGVDLLTPIMRALGNGFELHFTGSAAVGGNHIHMPPNMRDIGRLHVPAAVVAVMQDADALLLPSRSEGFGLVAAEAMACGLPVIATRGTSLSEVVEDNVTGILCPQDDVFAFVAAVKMLAEDIELHTRMSWAARRRVVDEFSLRRMVDSYAHIYAEYARV